MRSSMSHLLGALFTLPGTSTVAFSGSFLILKAYSYPAANHLAGR